MRRFRALGLQLHTEADTGRLRTLRRVSELSTSFRRGDRFRWTLKRMKREARDSTYDSRATRKQTVLEQMRMCRHLRVNVWRFQAEKLREGASSDGKTQETKATDGMRLLENFDDLRKQSHKTMPSERVA
ncbi:uncharacterized protein PGTG_09242 [Puccinia graminis f. sp. tritici CRL 75-36-700-3]|uniref:Uncharacterized protein n=1 Tax=Puccinia graminis f. sp. tritici (strain CRL 75-36-700-3 / race SCCL) TaxID=418459 RepID=E3KG18_PUCGT|nr:uncharacterized protein PGTG_09242 [Puccinia graminis f. sp. tritici CRL 75-36-700-3]EFP83289.1 hypothetical protein PGTG_09242 [Puccinia graminis f. sp. tritici CRL 75-36-700-3]